MSIATQLQRFNQAKAKREREEQLALETSPVPKREAAASVQDVAGSAQAATIAMQEQRRASADVEAARKEKDDEKARLRDLEIHNRQQAATTERNQIKDAMRAEDDRALAERRAVARDQQTTSRAPDREATAPTLERGNEGRPEYFVDTLALDRGGAATLGYGQVSRGVALYDYTRERSLAGAGTEHTSPNKYENYIAASAPEQEASPASTVEPTYEPRFGAEAIPGTEASRDRDELDAEGGKGYHEQFDATNEERTVDRSGDDYSDRVPQHAPEHAPVAFAPAGQGGAPKPSHPNPTPAPAPSVESPQAARPAPEATPSPTPTPSHDAARSAPAASPSPAAKTHNPYTPTAHQATTQPEHSRPAPTPTPTPSHDAARSAPAAPAATTPEIHKQPSPAPSTEPPQAARPTPEATPSPTPEKQPAPDYEGAPIIPQLDTPAKAETEHSASTPARQAVPEASPTKTVPLEASSEPQIPQLPEMDEKASSPNFGDTAEATTVDDAIEADHDGDGKTTETEAEADTTDTKQPQTANHTAAEAPEAKPPTPSANVEHQAESGQVTIKEDMENEDDYGL